MSIIAPAEVDANATYTITLGGITDPGDDTLSSAIIHWGDGTTTAYSGAGDYSHVYDGSVATPVIEVRTSDEDGDYISTTATLTVNDEEIEPPTATGEIQEFTLRNEQVQLTLDIDSDEPVSGIIVDWGDGTLESFADASALFHDYDTLGVYDVSVQLVTDSGSFDIGKVDDIDVGIRIGDAPQFYNFFAPMAWQNAWTDEGIGLSHKANTGDINEAWSELSFSGWSSSTLSGVDIFMGQLGVSGQTSPTGTVYQMLDGTEGIRINLEQPAFNGEITFSDLYANESGNLDEQARIQLFDENDQIVSEHLVTGSDSGEVTQQFSSASAFSYVVITTGAYNGNGEFVQGSYTDDLGLAAGGAANTGSELLIDAMQFGYRADESTGLLSIATAKFDFSQRGSFEIDVYRGDKSLDANAPADEPLPRDVIAQEYKVSIHKYTAPEQPERLTNVDEDTFDFTSIKPEPVQTKALSMHYLLKDAGVSDKHYDANLNNEYVITQPDYSDDGFGFIQSDDYWLR